MTDESGPFCPECIKPLTFDVDANPPDRNAPKLRDRKNSIVKAMYDGQPAGFVIYGLGPAAGTISITRIETEEEFRCRGCATQMLSALQDAFPDLRIVDGGNCNSTIGDLVLGKWLAAGSMASE